MKATFCCILFLLTSFFSSAQGKYTASTPCDRGCAPMFFVENMGQVTDQDGNPRKDIQYVLKAAPGLNIFVGNGAIHYQFYRKIDSRTHVAANKFKLGINGLQPTECEEYEMYRLDMAIEAANTNAIIISEEKQIYNEYNYTVSIASDNVVANAYNRITYKNIYPGVDWILYIKNGRLEYDFEVKPGAYVSGIRLRYSGAVALNVTRDQVCQQTPIGNILEGKLYCFEKTSKKEIKSTYISKADVVSVQVAPYNGTLVVDPQLQWSTYYGGSQVMPANSTVANKIVVDASNNIYVSGTTNSVNNIATTGSFSSIYNGDDDAFLAKFNTDGNIIWATYFGGPGAEGGVSSPVDDSGNIYIGGNTSSTTNIATPGAYHSSFGAGTLKAFLAKFSSSGVLDWSTYFGGSVEQGIVDIACDRKGNVYVTGNTLSPDGIATPGAFDTVFNDSVKAFVAKFSGAGSLVWSTYFGGNRQNGGAAITCDSNNNIYITGSTNSTSGIATLGAYQTTYGGGSSDGFIAKFSDSGSLAWSTYLGGSDEDVGVGLIASKTGKLFVTGNTSSPTGISTTGAFKTTLSGISDAFLSEFTFNGALNWATYNSGNLGEAGFCIAIDKKDNIYIGGLTKSTDSIATAGAYDYTLTGIENAFISKYNVDGSLLWGSYFGADSLTECTSIACDNIGNFYIAGGTTSHRGIATPNAYDTSYFGTHGYVAFIAKFDSTHISNVDHENAIFQNIKLYPNPATDIIYVSWSGQGLDPQELNVDILNMQGQVVYKTKLPALLNRTDIPVLWLPDGMYTLVLQNSVSRIHKKFSVLRR